MAEYIPEEGVRAGGNRPKAIITDASKQVQKVLSFCVFERSLQVRQPRPALDFIGQCVSR